LEFKANDPETGRLHHHTKFGSREAFEALNGALDLTFSETDAPAV
jgi:hypothetical protein